jgi:hypothetical protein
MKRPFVLCCNAKKRRAGRHRQGVPTGNAAEYKHGQGDVTENAHRLASVNAAGFASGLQHLIGATIVHLIRAG